MTNLFKTVVRRVDKEMGSAFRRKTLQPAYRLELRFGFPFSFPLPFDSFNSLLNFMDVRAGMLFW